MEFSRWVHLGIVVGVEFWVGASWGSVWDRFGYMLMAWGSGGQVLGPGGSTSHWTEPSSNMVQPLLHGSSSMFFDSHRCSQLCMDALWFLKVFPRKFADVDMFRDFSTCALTLGGPGGRWKGPAWCECTQTSQRAGAPAGLSQSGHERAWGVNMLSFLWTCCKNKSFKEPSNKSYPGSHRCFCFHWVSIRGRRGFTFEQQLRTKRVISARSSVHWASS